MSYYVTITIVSHCYAQFFTSETKVFETSECKLPNDHFGRLTSVTLVKSKSNLHYTRRITPKRVTSGGAHLRGLAPGQHSSEETSQRWRVVGDTVPI